jgi:murein DD-endopeptidase MepM/ murein hydrolase activator NlpD
VRIWHNDYDITTLYAHLSQMVVKRGEDIVERQIIGLSGSTGQSTAPHLHFEIILPTGERVDPLPYLTE